MRWYATVAEQPDQAGGGQVFPTYGAATQHIRHALNRAAREGRYDSPAAIMSAATLAEAMRLAGSEEPE